MSVAGSVGSDIEISNSEQMSNLPKKQHAKVNNVESPSVEINSSIVEFLDLERKCLNSAGGDNSEVDLKTLIEEINRLSGDSSHSGAVFDDAGDRSIEDIINEAQRLMDENCETQEELQEQTFSPRSLSNSMSARKTSVQINNNQSVEQKCDQNCSKANFNEDDCANEDAMNNSATYNNESFDTESDAFSLPEDNDDQPGQVDELEARRLLLRTVEEIDNPISSRAEYADKRFNGNDFAPSPEQHNDRSIGDHLSIQSKYTKKTSREKNSSNYCHACTSPMSYDGDLNFQTDDYKKKLKKSEENVKELEERLQAAKIQHNSVAVSFASLTRDHAALETKCYNLQVDVSRLESLLKSAESEVYKYKKISNQLRDANAMLQNQLQKERDVKQASITSEENQTKIITDLQRQIREMERILTKKYPDSVSALIVASKAPALTANDSARRLLEERIQKLESQSKTQTTQSQTMLQSVQSKFDAMQFKYEAHIADLESQVFNLQKINSELQHEHNKASSNKLTKETETQTETVITKPQNFTAKTKKTTVAVQTPKIIQKMQPIKNNKQNIAHAANKEDQHLLATIRGLKQDLAAKEKTISKSLKELEENKKMVKRLQASLKMQGQAKAKEYDPQSFTDTDKHENEHIQNRALQMLQREYQSLVEKRLQDLNALQNTHERELAELDKTIHTLHNKIREKDSTISSLKGQIKTKVSALEKRQIEREKTLQTLVSKLSNGKHDKDWINM